MALWMVIVVVGFLFFWIALGEYQGVINSSILILLGLNATTGLLAMQLDSEKTSGATTSSSFYMDWISDGDGPQLQRIQVILWTVVLAFVFLYNVAYKFTFPVFDTNLLLLMGIAQAAYIGFKPGELPKGLQPKTIDPQTAVAGERKSYTIKGANLAAATRAEFVLGNVTAPASVLASHDEQIQLTAKLESPGDWTPRIASGSDDPIKAPQTVKVVAAPQITPLTAIADKSTSFTIKGANLTGAKVDFVFGGTTIPIDKSKFVASADDQIALPGDTALPRGEWAVRITLASGEDGRCAANCESRSAAVFNTLIELAHYRRGPSCPNRSTARPVATPSPPQRRIKAATRLRIASFAGFAGCVLLMATPPAARAAPRRKPAAGRSSRDARPRGFRHAASTE